MKKGSATQKKSSPVLRRRRHWLAAVYKRPPTPLTALRSKKNPFIKLVKRS